LHEIFDPQFFPIKYVFGGYSLSRPPVPFESFFDRACGVIDTACILKNSNVFTNSNLYSEAQDGCFDERKQRLENVVTLSL
jgi:hypothetical protein